MNRRTPERIKIDRAALVDFLRNMRNDDWESTWRKAADLVRVGWRESDIQALIKSGQIVSEIRREFDSANNYGDMSWRFGGAAQHRSCANAAVTTMRPGRAPGRQSLDCPASILYSEGSSRSE